MIILRALPERELNSSSSASASEKRFTTLVFLIETQAFCSSEIIRLRIKYLAWNFFSVLFSAPGFIARTLLQITPTRPHVNVSRTLNLNLALAQSMLSTNDAVNIGRGMPLNSAVFRSILGKFALGKCRLESDARSSRRKVLTQVKFSRRLSLRC